MSTDPMTDQIARIIDDAMHPARDGYGPFADAHPARRQRVTDAARAVTEHLERSLAARDGEIDHLNAVLATEQGMVDRLRDALRIVATMADRLHQQQSPYYPPVLSEDGQSVLGLRDGDLAETGRGEEAS